jgi:outer membrane protein TolC
MTQALAAAGRVPAFQVDQAHQDELSARNSWVTAVETYEVALDRFKITLGLSTEVAIVLDYRELDALRGLGAAQPGESLEQVTAIALANRLDLMVERDQLADVERRVNVAQDQLRGDLSLTASASIDSGPGNEPLSAQFHEGAYRAGLDYNLPVDRFSERNRYRQALISLEQQRRSLSLAQDTVVLEVRDDYRGVQQALESYRIQQVSLDLARRRVESTSLLLRAGRATTRDLLESQNSYVDAQNRLTLALVDLFVARLELRRDMDVLEIDEKGAWSLPQVAAPETGETKHE